MAAHCSVVPCSCDCDRLRAYGKAAGCFAAKVAGIGGVHKPSQRRWSAIQDAVQNRVLDLAVERQSSRHHLIDHHPERPDVGAAIHDLAQRLLGRHVRRRSERGARFRELGAVLKAGHAEIGDFDLAFLCQQQIGAFDIAVDSAFFMRRVQALGCLDRNIAGLVEL